MLCKRKTTHQEEGVGILDFGQVTNSSKSQLPHLFNRNTLFLLATWKQQGKQRIQYLLNVLVALNCPQSQDIISMILIVCFCNPSKLQAWKQHGAFNQRTVSSHSCGMVDRDSTSPGPSLHTWNKGFSHITQTL